MSLPNPGMNFTPFDTLPAADLNDMVENIEALGAGTGLATAAVTPAKWTNPYKFSAYCSTGKTVTTATVIVDLQTEKFDTNNNFASSTYTAPVDGFYHFDASAWWGSAGTGTTEWARVFLKKNGSATDMPDSGRINGSGDASKYVIPSISQLLQLTAGDTIQLWIEAVGSRDLVNSPSHTKMSGFLVSQT